MTQAHARKEVLGQGNCRGFTLVELILVIVVLSISLPALMRLISITVEGNSKSFVTSEATAFAQDKMEEIIADKSSATRGYDWITAANRYASDVPSAGFNRSVTIETLGKTHNGVAYALVQVTVTHSAIPNIELVAWLTDY